MARDHDRGQARQAHRVQPHRQSQPATGLRHVVDQARQDGLGLVVGAVCSAAGQGRHGHADHQALRRFRGQGRLRIHDDRRGLVPEFGPRRPRSRRCGHHEGQGRYRHAGARGLRGEEEGGPVVVGAMVAARPADGRRAGAVPEVGHQGHQGRFHGSQRPADGRLLPQAHAEGGASTSCWWTCTAPIHRPA